MAGSKNSETSIGTAGLATDSISALTKDVSLYSLKPSRDAEVSSTSAKNQPSGFDRTRNSGPAKEDEFNKLRTLMAFGGFAAEKADENDSISSLDPTDFVRGLEKMGIDAYPIKKLIEKASGKSFESLASGNGADRVSFSGFMANSVDDIPGFSRSGNESLRSHINKIILARTADMDSLAYSLGSRTGKNGAIDCSGFVSQVGFAVDRNLNGGTSALSKTMNGTSESIYENASRKAGGTGRITKNTLDQMEESGALRAGMIISMDKGATNSGFDAGRRLGIDHIVMTAERNGHLVVVESSSGKGVHETNFDDWIAKKGSNTTLFVTDMVKLAQGSMPDAPKAHMARSPSPAMA